MFSKGLGESPSKRVFRGEEEILLNSGGNVGDPARERGRGMGRGSVGLLRADGVLSAFTYPV